MRDKTFFQEAIQWLQADKKRQADALSDVDRFRREVAASIQKVKSENAELEKRLEALSAELEAAVDEEKKVKAQLARSPEENETRLADGKKKAESLLQDKADWEAALKSTQEATIPVFQEIDRLNAEIERCQGVCAQKSGIIAEQEKIPQQLKALRQRLDSAQRLKGGFLQKADFSEELLTEMRGGASDDKKRKLAQYKKLCAELQDMIFE